MAFNHQLWFAASGAMLACYSNTSINPEVIHFLDRVLRGLLRIDPSGRIIHRISIQRHSKLVAMSNGLIDVINSLRRTNSSHSKNHMPYKEMGYHAFNMYAFSLLKQCMPQHPLWQSPKFISALIFMNKAELIHGLENNIYGYPYNPPGFEVPFAIQEFSHLSSFSKSREWWVEQQLNRCYNKEENMMNRSTEDKNTHSARLYESTRLKDMEISINGFYTAPH